ncbi:PKD domain-containing protein [Polaribacter porphyrae]|nr:PKD domain-containing protein [Polaribacter porphyrae]
MKNLIKKVSIISLSLLSILLINSCEDNGDNNSSALGAVEARFTRVQEGKTITFINISENATSYLWDFGDGTTSTLIEPVKKYLNGTYTIKLTATNENGSSTVEDSILIDGCVDETAENIDPANGPLNWTFLNANGNASFDAFGNIGGGIVTNPKLDAVNSSCNVFSYTKAIGCETWSGAGYVLNTSLDFSTMSEKIFKLKVYAETQITDVTLLLEFQPFPNNNPFEQRLASITQVGEWQELTFDFSNVNTGTFKNIVIYFERGAACDGDVYYFDDLIQQ